MIDSASDKCRDLDRITKVSNSFEYRETLSSGGRRAVETSLSDYEKRAAERLAEKLAVLLEAETVRTFLCGVGLVRVVNPDGSEKLVQVAKVEGY